ncbi:MAG: pyridoxamine 5'-phosphate oxidase family protein [Ornithinimicrobium sp.]
MSDLSERDCWELLAKARYGRLAYHLAGEVHIVPINYVTSTAGRQLFFRSAEGSKLLGVVMDHDVAFEIDDVVGDTAWSVVARGRAELLEGEEARATKDLPLVVWVAGATHRVVAVDITEVTGRRFELRRAELHRSEFISQ